MARTGRRRLGWRERLRRDLAAALVATVAAVGVVQFAPAELRFGRSPFAGLGPRAAASPDAFGRSGAVRTLFTLPGHAVRFPLTVGDPHGLRYRWVALDSAPSPDGLRPLAGASLIAPADPGFYRLVIANADPALPETVVPSPVLAVMAPFDRKVGGILNGYRIGTYVAERLGVGRELPAGFVEVHPELLGLPVSAHLTLADFVTHDPRQRDVWPKYVALSPRLLDKLELVIAEVARTRPRGTPLAVSVQSGFRTPAYNAGVVRAAQDSRHQQGDAADVAMDVDADGRVTSADSRLLAAAVERVEHRHPDLAGGLGLYVGRRYRTPYIHIDARGARARWRG